MGIPAILAMAAKHVSWGKVADLALQYGPDIVRKLGERLQARPVSGNEATPVRELSERIRELEGVLIKQEEIIEQQNRTIALLRENGKTLQARLNIFMTISAVAALIALTALVVSIRQ